jgi:putative transport protein
VGNLVAYPFVVAGPILFLYLAFLLLKPKIDVPIGAGIELLEVALQRPEYGQTI